ncbi:MAG TPA: PLP-dependent aspartate aminotransferase family protein [Symbiobacteriaceae bacterium]|nr:PLP-dependent aspartate aminotransferase family protein [Symbiobacteriaceae bacterium]
MSQFDSGKRRPHSDRIDTIATHAGDDPFRFLGAAAPPIIETSTFVFESYEALEEAFAHPDGHCIYTRGNNPTVRVAEEKIAALEGAEACRLFGSGMAAISSAILAFVNAGDHIVSLRTVYGPAYKFMAEWLPRFGVMTTFIDGTDPAEWAEACRPNTRLFYLESPSTMVFKLQDLPAVTAIARERSIRTIIDNSYCTMLLQRPLELGVDLCVYSATKYLNGHSDVVAGAAVGSRALIGQINKAEFPLLGGIIGPFEAWLIARGLRTLPARMRQHQASTAQVVEYLAGHPRVRRVYYPGHPSHPQYDLACRQMKGASSLLSFELDTAELAAVKRFVNGVRFIGLGVSWGGHESLIFAPLIAQSRELPPERWQSANLVRLHVGLEDPADLIADLEQALSQL